MSNEFTPKYVEPRNRKQSLGRDVLLALGVVATLVSVSLWFEIRKNRNDFYPQSWLILAPFDLSGGEEAARRFDFLSTDGGEGTFIVRPSMTHTMADGATLRWTEFLSPGGEVPFLTMSDLLKGKVINAVAYAQTIVSMSEAKNLLLGVAADDGIKIWVNGNVTLDQGPGKPYIHDVTVVPVMLNKGDNIVLVKSTQLYGGWGFALHFFDK